MEVECFRTPCTKDDEKEVCLAFVDFPYANIILPLQYFYSFFRQEDNDFSNWKWEPLDSLVTMLAVEGAVLLPSIAE